MAAMRLEAELHNLELPMAANGQLQSLHKKCIRPLYVVASEYDDVWKNHEQSVKQHNELVAVNVELREERLEKKECVR